MNSELSTVIPNFTDSQNYTFGNVEQFTFISYAKQLKEQGSTYYSSNIEENPAFALVDKFDKIKENTTIPENVRNITEQIYRNLASISEQLLINSENVLVHTPNTNYYIDPVTGLDQGPTNYTFIGQLDQIVHLQSSAGSDIDSAIICATGVNQDTGQNCHNNN